MSELLRHAQLGGRAAPEQIGGRRRHHDEVGAESAQLGLDVRKPEIEHVSVQQQRRMACLRKMMLGYAELERQMRRAASEIDAAVELPVRIDQGDPCHAS